MKQFYPALNETVLRSTLPNGLTVVIVPRPGFEKKIAYFATNFGAIHTEFSYAGKNHKVPAGVAHFLEHKLFELPDRDINAEFAARGANVNAFTGYDMTAYYFSCTQHFYENLRLLLEFVSTGYFEEESVRREVGIIDQEIGMNVDSPDSRVFETLMEAMYPGHPIHVPILGSRESIRRITPEILQLCHDAFYTPENMILCIVGDVAESRVLHLAEEVLGQQRRPTGEKIKAWQQTERIVPPSPLFMEVSMPSFQMGFLDTPVGTGEDALRREIIGDLAAEALFGESSPLYLSLYEKGVIDSSFGGGFESIDGCAFLTCGGDSEDPQAIRDALLSQAQILISQGLDEKDFLRMKRSALGRRIRDLDSFDTTAFRVCAYHMLQYPYFDFLSVYPTITSGEVLEFLRRVIRSDGCGLSVVYPIEKHT
jgi:predicted Zn-dependent peptidase